MSANGDPKIDELARMVGEIRDRVRERHVTRAKNIELALPDLTPILEARDAAYAKVAAIGQVNPRPGGALNALVQRVKRLVSRALDWHVREQVAFNRETVRALDAAIEALNENNRALERLAELLAQQAGPMWEARREFADIAAHWQAWRPEWERKLAANETHFLRSAADLQAAFQHRVTLLEGSARETVRTQHADFMAALDRARLDIQNQLWADMEKVKVEYERLIHYELRSVRMRGLTAPAGAAAAPAATPIEIDWLKFAEKFRGPEEYVRESQRHYVEKFAGRTDVLDLGCGRGEFLGLMREAGVPARGIEVSDELVRLCRERGLQAEEADLFSYLESLPDASLGGVFCAQVVEHLDRGAVSRLIRLAHAKLRPNGLLAVETPNPECLAIFATHFYLDPSHTRPVPPALLTFYFEEAGFGRLETTRLQAAVESMPPLAELPAPFRDAFFGSLDYCVTGIRL